MKKLLAALLLLPALLGAQILPPPLATQAQAEAGTNNQAYMSPLRTAQAIAAQGGGGGAPTNATYITQIPSGGLSAEQAMSLLGTGIVKNTTTTGVQSIAVAGTDYQAAITFGTGVQTALGVNVGSAGAPVLFNGVGGTPLSLVGTNITGTASGLTAGAASAVAVGGITGLGTGVATWLATPSSANLASALTDETGSGVAVFGTSPAITTSITTGSATFALVNTTATTVNFAGGASTALNIGNASGATSILGILAVDGATASSSTALIVPASTTSVSSLRLPHGSAPTSPVNGDLWTTTSGLNVRINGSTVLLGSGGGSGTVTVVGSGSLTSTALVTGGGTTTLQTPAATATMDTSGNIVTPGTFTSGSGGSTAGGSDMGQGTANTPSANHWLLQAPASIATAYTTVGPGAVGTGFWYGTAASTTETLTRVTANGTGNVLLSAGTAAIASGKTLTVSNSLTLAGTDGTTMTFPTTNATLARTDAANTFTGASTASAWVLTSPTITTKLNPTSDDGAPLGDTTHNWSDLFLASGAVINIANSNWVATHTSGILTVGTGDLRVTTAGTNAASVVTVGGTQTLTNKWVQPRTNTIGSSATPAINTDTTDEFTITALAANITSMTSSLTGTPVNGQQLIVRILDNGTARTIAWGASFAARGASLPTTTVISKYLYAMFLWNSTASTWDCISTAQES